MKKVICTCAGPEICCIYLKYSDTLTFDHISLLDVVSDQFFLKKKLSGLFVRIFRDTVCTFISYHLY